MRLMSKRHQRALDNDGPEGPGAASSDRQSTTKPMSAMFDAARANWAASWPPNSNEAPLSKSCGSCAAPLYDRPSPRDCCQCASTPTAGTHAPVFSELGSPTPSAPPRHPPPNLKPRKPNASHIRENPYPSAATPSTPNTTLNAAKPLCHMAAKHIYDTAARAPLPRCHETFIKWTKHVHPNPATQNNCANARSPTLTYARLAE